MLNGVALTITPSSAWLFQYGASSSYGQYSREIRVGLGLTAVSQTISDLTPNTMYHFRLVVVQGDPSNASSYAIGEDGTFTTPAPAPTYGATSVRSHLLSVQRGVTSIRFLCGGRSGSMCKGNVALAARNARGRLVDCGTGSLLATAGHDHTIASRLSSSCLTLLSKARRHTLRAELRVTLEGAQTPLNSLVTLVDPVSSSMPRATLAEAHHRTRSHHSHSHAHRARRHATRR